VEIALGPYVIRVLTDDKTDLALADEGREGDSDVRAGTIRVRSDLDHARRREVLVHELLHHVVAMTHLQVRWSEDEQEEVVRALSPWLAMGVTVVVAD
jgi:hypothetical protein